MLVSLRDNNLRGGLIVKSKLNNLFKILGVFLFFREDWPMIYFLGDLYGISVSIVRILFYRFGYRGDEIKVKEIKQVFFNIIIEFLDLYFISHGQRLQMDNDRLRRYLVFSNYKSHRYLYGLPVNGQRTSSNARTCRSLVFHKKVIFLVKSMQAGNELLEWRDSLKKKLEIV